MPRGLPNWLKDFVYTKLTQPHPTATPSTSPYASQSFSFLTIIASSASCQHPLFEPSNLAYLSVNYVASIANVLQVPKPSCYIHA